VHFASERKFCSFSDLDLLLSSESLEDLDSLGDQVAHDEGVRAEDVFHALSLGRAGSLLLRVAELGEICSGDLVVAIEELLVGLDEDLESWLGVHIGIIKDNIIIASAETGWK